jgi:hypothetical protein
VCEAAEVHEVPLSIHVLVVLLFMQHVLIIPVLP